MNRCIVIFIIALACTTLSIDVLIMGNIPLPIISIHGIKFNDDNIIVYEGGEFVSGLVYFNIKNLFLQFTAYADMNIPLEETDSLDSHIGYEIGLRPFYKIGSGSVNMLGSIGVRYAYHNGYEENKEHIYKSIQYWAEPYINFEFSESSLSFGAGVYYDGNIGLITSMYYGTTFVLNDTNSIEYSMNIDCINSKDFYDFKFGVFIGYTL